jgi:hypothetical protein
LTGELVAVGNVNPVFVAEIVQVPRVLNSMGEVNVTVPFTIASSLGATELGSVAVRSMLPPTPATMCHVESQALTVTYS